ncbi:MAG: hypothetical protein P8H56_05205 [Crocinitomicaceae bacterium]|nr:hypothetical protein [Crocinitomicaceae bacterium]
MEQSPEDRKQFLAELNEISRYTATILHGEEVTKVRVRQIKKYFNRTFNMLNRLTKLKGDMNNNSFKYGYGGKLLVRKIMLEMGIVAKKNNDIRKATYELVIPPGDINLELVSRIIVEVYLHRNEIEPL